MPERRFLAGLDLAGSFYEDVVRPRLAAIEHSAALIGPGSDVLGYDDLRSTDHFWGPRLQIFVGDSDLRAAGEALQDLPDEHMGWPTRIGSDKQPFRRYVDVYTVPQCGVRDTWGSTPATASQPSTGSPCRSSLSSRRPLDGSSTMAWAAWRRCAPRSPGTPTMCGFGSSHAIGRVSVRNRPLSAAPPRSATTSAPASSRPVSFAISCGSASSRSGPTRRTASGSAGRLPGWRRRRPQDRHWPPPSGRTRTRLAKPRWWRSYEYIGRRQNVLGVSRSEDARVSPFHSRPYLVSAADRFAAACVDAIDDVWLRTLPLVGGIDQWVDSTDVLSHPERAGGLKAWYTASLGIGPGKDGGMTTAVPPLHGVQEGDVAPGARWADAAAQNRLAWEEIADVRIHRWSNRAYAADFFANGGCSLDPRVRDALDDLKGVRALHLMCATGEESLSLAILGAHVTAVDLSPRQVELASEKARAAGLEVAFVAADVGDLPGRIANGGFDLVYTGGGVLVWVPDIKRWAAVIAGALRPGGRFILWDYHPVAMRWETVDGQLRLDSSYFDGPGPLHTRGWTHFAAPADAQTLKYEFTWTLGEIVTALADAGLFITRMGEFPSDATWKFGDALDAAQALPGLVLLEARRP